MRWIAAGLTATALFVAACTGSGNHTTATGDTGATTTAAALEQPSIRCGAPDTKATLVRFKAADGTSLDGVMVGDGQAGAVLVHEYPADLCGFWPFADYLARHGVRAFDIDLRCFGQSECPDGVAEHRVIEDVAAAVATLRRHGVTMVALVGASMGGAAVLIAGTTVQPPVAAVVSLSGEADPTKLVGGIPLNAGAAVKRLSVPTMFVVATVDFYAAVHQTRVMYNAVKARGKRLYVLSGQFAGRHGWDLLTNTAGATFSPLATKVAAFIKANTRD